MKKIIIIVFIALVLSSCQKNLENVKNNTFKNNIEQKEVSNLKTVWVVDFKKELEKGDWVLIDLRTPAEVAEGVIPWVKLNLDYYSKDFLDKLKTLDKNKKYLIYCHSWHRSWKTFGIMKKLWFKNVVNLRYWINSWIQSWKKLETFEDRDFFWKFNKK